MSTPSGGGGSSATPTVLRKFRCARLVLQVTTIRSAIGDGVVTPSETAELEALDNRMDALGCSDFFVV